MKYQYGEMFKRLGIPGMGHQGATWCALNPEGILVLMAHQNYFRRAESKYQYEHPKCEPETLRGSSAKRSLDILGSYFAVGRTIILPIAVFVTDGAPRGDGTWEPSVFDYATGDYFEGRMREFERETAYLLCDIDQRRSI